MNSSFKYSIALLLFCLAISTQVKAQNKIVIDDTASQKIITKFQNAEKKISANDLKAAEIQIQIDAKYIPVKLFKIEKGNPKPQPQPGGLKLITPAIAGFVSYTLAPMENYKDDALELLLIMPNNKTFSFRIATKKDDSGLVETAEGDGTNAEPKIADCVVEQLKKINFTFIDDALMKSLSADPCGGTVCKDCEPTTNVIIYDFKTNETSRKPKHPIVGRPIEFIVRNVNPYLYNVTISDTTINYGQDTEGTYLSLLLGPGSDGVAVQNNEECPVSDAQKLVKAVEDLYEQLNKFYDEILHTSPYTDASCFGEKIRTVQKAIDAELSKNFKNSLHITGYQSLEGYIKDNTDIFDEKILKKLNEAYHKIESKHFAYAYKIPEVDNVDEVQLRFNIVPKDKDLALSVVNKGVLRTYTKGGFKIDVSSGLYYGFFNNHNYALRADSVQQSSGTFKKGKRVFSEENGKGEFGFASFLHFYPRTGGWLNVAGTIGAGVNLSDKPKTRYFGGVSMMMGRANSRIGINLGVVMGNATRISSQYTKDASGNFLMLPEDEKEVVTTQKFNSSFFVSVSYNLPFALKGAKKPQTTEAPAMPVEDKKEATTEDEKKTADAGDKTAGEETAAKSQSSVTQPIIKTNTTGSKQRRKVNRAAIPTAN